MFMDEYEELIENFETNMARISKYGEALQEIAKAESEGRISKQEASENIAFIIKEVMWAIHTIKDMCLALLTKADLNYEETQNVHQYYTIMEFWEKQLKEALGS